MGFWEQLNTNSYINDNSSCREFYSESRMEIGVHRK